MGREDIFGRTTLGALLRHTGEAGEGEAPYITCPSMERKKRHEFQ